MTAAKKLETEHEIVNEKLQSSLLFLHEPISGFAQTIVVCKLDSTIAHVSRQMTVNHVSAALLASEKDEIVGIVTDHDLRERVVSQKLDADTPVHRIMSAPLICIQEYALIYEALMLMEENGVTHLAVKDKSGRIVNVLDNSSLIKFQNYAPIILSQEILKSESVEEIARFSCKLIPTVKSLLHTSAYPKIVTEMLTSTCDAVTERLIQLSTDFLGQPPVSFAFIGMGSQGRRETTLFTDQDNGIIFAEPEKGQTNLVTEYFLQMGRFVSDGLNQAGYSYCKGNVMASNPRWCRSLPEWISGFQDWVFKSEPQEIIDLSIFFDFRTVYGNTELTNALRENIHTTLKSENAVFYHLAQDALMFKPSIRLPGALTFGGDSGDINLKDAMMPIVCFARLYALRHQIIQTHTLDRIEALWKRNIIIGSSREDIIDSYNLLMKLRLHSQIEALQSGSLATNIIQSGKPGNIQKEMIKQAFVQISAIQKKISYDFLGGQ